MNVTIETETDTPRTGAANFMCYVLQQWMTRWMMAVGKNIVSGHMMMMIVMGDIVSVVVKLMVECVMSFGRGPTSALLLPVVLIDTSFVFPDVHNHIISHSLRY